MPGVSKRFVNSFKTVLLVKFLSRDHVPERFKIASVKIFSRVIQRDLNKLVRNSGASRFGNAVHFLQLTNTVCSNERCDTYSAYHSVGFGYPILSGTRVIDFGKPSEIGIFPCCSLAVVVKFDQAISDNKLDNAVIFKLDFSNSAIHFSDLPNFIISYEKIFVKKTQKTLDNCLMFVVY